MTGSRHLSDGLLEAFNERFQRLIRLKITVSKTILKDRFNGFNCLDLYVSSDFGPARPYQFSHVTTLRSARTLKMSRGVLVGGPTLVDPDMINSFLFS